MTNPDSAMAAAAEIVDGIWVCNHATKDTVIELAAIIRKHQAKEIGDLVECLRAGGECLSYAEFAVWRDSIESLLSRYPEKG